MPRRARRRTWIVVESEDGTYDLQRNGRPLASGLSGNSVHRHMTKRWREGDRILREERDGARFPARLSDFGGDRRKA